VGLVQMFEDVGRAAFSLLRIVGKLTVNSPCVDPYSPAYFSNFCV
jgi:hypothetical protein